MNIPEDHIVELPKFMPENVCDHIIETCKNQFELTETVLYNKVVQGQDKRLTIPKGTGLFNQIQENVLDVAKKYVAPRYVSLIPKFSDPKINISIQYINIQLNEEYDGFHMWHDDGKETRLITFIIYLNDIEEGGETEFLYQKTRIKPEKGKIVMFPCSYTHTHRGNPVLSNQEKYILTGWIVHNTPTTDFENEKHEQ
jgi:hypothetical protein